MLRDEQLDKSLLSQKEQQENTQYEKAKKKLERDNKTIGQLNLFQEIMFTWVHPLLSFGSKHPIEPQMMPQLSQKYTTQSQFNKFQNIWQNTKKSKRQGWTLIKALFKLHTKQWLLLLFVTFAMVILFLSFPVITALNTNFLDNKKDDIERGIILFLATILISIVHRLTFSQFFFRFTNLGIRLSNVVTMIIYHKSLKYSPMANKKFSEAEIINYSQVDAERLTYVGDQVAAFIEGPLIFVIGLFMLYFAVGISFLSTIGCMAIMLVISYFISKVTVRLNEKALNAKDERMKATEQMLDIIRYIKISAIQKFFYRKVDEKRQKEVQINLKKGLNLVLVSCTFWTTPPLLLTVTYLTFVLLGNEITSEIAFTTMIVINLFQYPLYSMPTAISQILQIVTSLKRIQKFIYTEQIQNFHFAGVCDEEKNAIEIENGNFYWRRQEKSNQNKEQNEGKQKRNNVPSSKIVKNENDEMNKLKMSQSQRTQDALMERKHENEELQKFQKQDDEGKPLYIHALRDINTTIRKGTFTMIVGDIGSGKSSLLLAILNQTLFSESSKIKISGNIAYSPQKPWIMSKTLKQNITFASEQDQTKFRKVIYYASLEADLKMLPKGVQTEIGQKGINISGGQKARVSLARSLYSDRDILLLDDILSAVDVHVGQFIVKETIGQFLKGKTIVMPTHAIKLASFADEIIVMKKGKILKKGRYEDIVNTEEFKQISEHEKQEKKKEKQQQDDLFEAEMAKVKEVMRMKTTSSGKQGEAEGQKTGIVEELMLPEDQQRGNITFKVLKQFISLNGGKWRFTFIVLIAMSSYTAVKTIGSIIIQLWCEEPEAGFQNFYLFAIMNVCMILFLFITSYTLTVSGARQSRSVHKQMIKRLLYASLGKFYNRIPTGRIVNRLTKDLRQLDEVIMGVFLLLITNLFQLFGTLIIFSYATSPLVLIPIVFVGFLTNMLRKYYLKTQMEVSRFQKSTNSPIVSGILSTISGLSTIRAFQKQQQFTTWQYEYFDLNKRVRLTQSALMNWFANAIGFLCFCISMACIGYCMFSQSGNSSLVGLLMTYALFVLFQVTEFLLCESNFETKLVSIERIYKFMEIEPEKGYEDYCLRWREEEEEFDEVFAKGDIKFNQLKVKYRTDLPDVIKGISCNIKDGQKIGIVGRTGAGKTTIINTLLGVTQISGGSILIDSKNINDIPLKSLRESVTMIDQDPTLIKSTFRQNLDLTGRYSDEQLQNTLKECNLWEVILEKGGLEAAVSNSSLSAGQKQLLCICRAFLKHCKIVLVDEATANIDVKHDAIIQKVINEKFKESTVLTIAHRLSTLENSDKIMVMEQGKLVQFGSPRELETIEGGVYSEMMRKNQQEMLK